MFVLESTVTITDRIPSREGYTFGGWLTDTGSIISAGSTVDLSGASTTFTAIWNEDE